MKDLCHDCRIEKGHLRKDDGFHTAVIKICEGCKQEKMILPERHYILKSEIKNMICTCTPGSIQVCPYCAAQDSETQPSVNLTPS